MTDRSGGPDGAADTEPRIEVGLATDVGRVRSGNEDSILCEPLESVLVAERGLGLAGSFEVVEVNPILDRQNATAALAVELLASALGKTIL